MTKGILAIANKLQEEGIIPSPEPYLVEDPGILIGHFSDEAAYIGFGESETIPQNPASKEKMISVNGTKNPEL